MSQLVLLAAGTNVNIYVTAGTHFPAAFVKKIVLLQAPMGLLIQDVVFPVLLQRLMGSPETFRQVQPQAVIMMALSVMPHAMIVLGLAGAMIVMFMFVPELYLPLRVQHFVLEMKLI